MNSSMENIIPGSQVDLVSVVDTSSNTIKESVAGDSHAAASPEEDVGILDPSYSFSGGDAANEFMRTIQDITAFMGQEAICIWVSENLFIRKWTRYGNKY